MHASQRGSVLLTVIAGILVLGVVGVAALSLMTGSVMTVVDGRETVQAAYLAESGKEIVRAQTESKSSGALMEAAVLLTESQDKNKGKGLAVDGKGFVKMKLYPAWFRWYKGKGDKMFHLSTSLEWPGLPTKQDKYPPGELDWLAISKKAVRYIGDINSLKFADEPADIYLIGKVTGTPSYNDEKQTLSVTPADNSFQYFPEYGGLIGFVMRRQTEEGKTEDGKAEDGDPQDTSVSDIRFLYDRMEEQKGKYIFYNVTVSPESTSTTAIEDVLANSDVALGQYFRVECESVTDYGARSALVWHTNGRNSLRYADNGGSGGGEDVAVGGNNADKLKEIFDGKVEDGKMTGDNIIGNLKKDDDELVWDFNATGKDNTHGSNTDIEINHFLKQGDRGNNQEYWWVAVARQWLAYQSGKSVPLESMMQYSFEPDSDDEDNKGKKDKDEEYQNYFTGILCRLAFVNASGSLSAEGTVGQGDGAQGIGVGVLQGEISFHNTENKVVRATVNPALLPGFSYQQKNFVISPEKRKEFYGVQGTPGKLGWVVEERNKSYTRLYPLLVVWAYDDTQSGKGADKLETSNDEAVGKLETLKPLAILVLADRHDDDYLSLTVKVEEKDGKNHLTVWLQEKDDNQSEDASAPQWPSDEPFLSNWVYMVEGEVSKGEKCSLSTTLAVGEAFRRVGIFSEAYAFKDMNDNHANIEIGNFFFTGTGSGGGSLFPGGLTPGIVN